MFAILSLLKLITANKVSAITATAVKIANGLNLAGAFSSAPSIASTSFLVLRITHPMILPDYLCWFLNHPNTVKAIKARQEVSGTLMIRKTDIENLEVLIPEVEDQKKIVAMDELSRREAILMKTIAERKQALINEILYKVL